MKSNDYKTSNDRNAVLEGRYGRSFDKKGLRSRKRLPSDLRLISNIRKEYTSKVKFLSKEKETQALDNLDQILKAYRKKGLKPKVFDISVSSLLTAIRNKSEIEGVVLSKMIQNPDFRFISLQDISGSQELSDTFAEFARQVKQDTLQEKLIQEAKAKAKASAEIRSKKADEFALNMVPIIRKLQEENDISSYHATANLLNEKGIKTSYGNDWSAGTLHLITKRFKKLSKNNHS